MPRKEKKSKSDLRGSKPEKGKGDKSNKEEGAEEVSPNLPAAGQHASTKNSPSASKPTSPFLIFFGTPVRPITQKKWGIFVCGATKEPILCRTGRPLKQSIFC